MLGARARPKGLKLPIVIAGVFDKGGGKHRLHRRPFAPISGTRGMQRQRKIGERLRYEDQRERKRPFAKHLGDRNRDVGDGIVVFRKGAKQCGTV